MKPRSSDSIPHRAKKTFSTRPYGVDDTAGLQSVTLCGGGTSLDYQVLDPGERSALESRHCEPGADPGKPKSESGFTELGSGMLITHRL